MSDDSENGLMQTMLTVTLNDSSPELAACIRRGPFAIPDEHEMVRVEKTREEQVHASCLFSKWGKSANIRRGLPITYDRSAPFWKQTLWGSL